MSYLIHSSVAASTKIFIRSLPSRDGRGKELTLKEGIRIVTQD